MTRDAQERRWDPAPPPCLLPPPPPLHTARPRLAPHLFSFPPPPSNRPLDPKDGKSTRRFSIFCGADDPSSGNHLEILAAAAYDVTRERRRRRRDEPEDDEEDDEEGGKSRKGSTCIPLPPTHPPERAARPPAGAELREEEICLDGRDSWHRGALDLLGRSFYGTLLLLVRVFADTPLVDLASLHTPS